MMDGELMNCGAERSTYVIALAFWIMRVWAPPLHLQYDWKEEYTWADFAGAILSQGKQAAPTPLLKSLIDCLQIQRSSDYLGLSLLRYTHVFYIDHIGTKPHHHSPTVEYIDLPSQSLLPNGAEPYLRHGQSSRSMLSIVRIAPLEKKATDMLSAIEFVHELFTRSYSLFQV
jgi:hypothetical protein